MVPGHRTPTAPQGHLLDACNGGGAGVSFRLHSFCPGKINESYFLGPFWVFVWQANPIDWKTGCVVSAGA